MNILVVAHDLPPALNPQAIQVGRLLYHLPAEWKIFVATSTYTTPHACDAYADWKRHATDSLSVPSIHANPLLGLWMRLFPFLFRIPEPSRWDMSAMKREILAKWGSLKFDRLLSFGYPFASHLLGLELKNHFRCPWTAHFSDPWAQSQIMGFGPLSRPLNQRWEQRVVTAADQLIFVSEETRDFYAANYPQQHSKIQLLEHSFDPTLYPPPNQERRSGQPLLIRFLGNLYGGRRFATLFEALQLLMQRHSVTAADLQVELVLSYRRSLGQEIQSYGLETLVKNREPVNYRESLSLMRSADVLLTIDTPLPPSFPKNLFFQSKLVDYIGSRQRILALAGPGASRRIVAKYGGAVVSPEDVEGLAKILLGWIELRRKNALPAFTPSEPVYQEYHVDRKAAHFAELLQ